MPNQSRQPLPNPHRSRWSKLRRRESLSCASWPISLSCVEWAPIKLISTYLRETTPASGLRLWPCLSDDLEIRIKRAELVCADAGPDRVIRSLPMLYALRQQRTPGAGQGNQLDPRVI